MRSYLKGLMSEAGSRASYTESDAIRPLMFALYVAVCATLDLTRGY